MPWHRLSKGVAYSYSSAPDWAYNDIDIDNGDDDNDVLRWQFNLDQSLNSVLSCRTYNP